MSEETISPISSIEKTFAFWTLRAWLGLRALLTGIEKFAGTRTDRVPLLDEFGEPDISGAMVEVEQKVYGFSHYHGIPASLQLKFESEPLLPGFLLVPFDWLLGPLLILFGLGLLVGCFTRYCLLGMGVLYSVLAVGLILLRQDAGVAWLGIHVLLVVAALLLSPFNRFGVTRL